MPTMNQLAPLPLGFELNAGQADPAVHYLARGMGYTLFLTPSELVIVLTQPPFKRAKDRTAPGPPDATVFRMRFIGADPAALAEADGQLSGIANYFIGNDPAQWRTNIPTYRTVRYRALYPGIDLVYYGSEGALEFDFLVEPAADPGRIQLQFAGPGQYAEDAAGNLSCGDAARRISLRRPRLYQRTATGTSEVSGGFHLNDRQQLGFRVDSYQADAPLVIDPVLTFSTYLGGNAVDDGYGIAVADDGHIYVAGATSSTDFPTVQVQAQVQPESDPERPRGQTMAFVSKIALSAAGPELVYSTYLGGEGFSGANSIASDSNGAAYVTGYTDSGDFPMVRPLPGQDQFRGNQAAFVSKLSGDSGGIALAYSTYLGGNGATKGQGIAVDSAGNAYVTGDTAAPDFPTLHPLPSQERLRGTPAAFITKLSFGPDGAALVYSSYLGGDGATEGKGVAVDSRGNAYLTGKTAATDFPAVHPLPGQEQLSGTAAAFVAKINQSPGGIDLAYSSYLGGTGQTEARSIAVDAQGHAYLTGSTDSADFPTVRPLPGQERLHDSGAAFVAKITGSDDIALAYATYLGVDSGASGYGIAVDGNGNAYVTGTTAVDFPLVNALPGQEEFQGFHDAFVSKIIADSDGTVLAYSTYLGGKHSASAGLGIAVDSAGSAYVTGYLMVFTSTDVTNFPMVQPLPGQDQLRGTEDAFVCCIRSEANLIVSKTDCPDSLAIGKHLAYTVRVINTGPDTATGVILTNALPTGVTLAATTVSQGDYSQSGSVLTYRLGTLHPGAAADINIALIPGAPGDLTHQIRGSALEAPVAPETSIATRSVLPTELTVVASSIPNPVWIFKKLLYSITVINNGPDPVSGIVLADTLPAGVKLVSVKVSQGTSNHSDATVICDLGTLASAEFASVDIVVVPRSRGMMTNLAKLTSNASAPKLIVAKTLVI